jgi:hypothetical protein
VADVNPIPGVIRERRDRTTELGQAKDQNSILEKELADCREAADADSALLASGLRLAFANEALEVENRLLRQDVAKGPQNRKIGKPSPGAAAD